MSFDHNTSLSGVFNSINSYCQDKTAKIKSSLISKGNTVLSSGPTPKYTTMDGNVPYKPSPPIPPPRPMSRPPLPSSHFQSGENMVDQNQVTSMPKLHPGMSEEEFRVNGRKMVDYLVNYIKNIEQRRVVPDIEPGYLRDLIPKQPPQIAESYEHVMKDFENFIMPGVTHWQHPRFHAYFPAGNSWPSVLAGMLSDALGCVGFSWAACPAMTELEMIMLDWFGNMMGLPKEFLPFTPNGNGGGVIQGSASECNFVALLAARFEILKKLKERFPFVEEGLLMSKLVAYCSKESHSSVEKACMIAMVKLRIMETDSLYRLRGDTLYAAIQEDRNLGLIPFFVSTTLGTTSVCSFDVLAEVGPVCSENDIWLHVDGAYAGSAMICPEFRYLMKGIEHAMSFNTNPNKWMLVNFDCSTMWCRDRFKLTQALVVDPLYLQHSWTDKAIDYRHWGIPLSRRFRALKLWFVIRMYGVEGLQKYIREHVRLAKKFESLLRNDDRFEIIGEVILGLVCFRLKGSDEINRSLLTQLNSSGKIHMVPASLSSRFVIRFCVCQEHATDKDIQVAYDIITQTAQEILYEPSEPPLVEEDENEYVYEETRTSLYDVSNSGMDRSESYRLINSSESIPSGREKSIDSDSRSQNIPRQPSINDELFDRKKIKTLSEKRSFLVRMVSDPKCYNPKIVRHLNRSSHRKMSQDIHRDHVMRKTIEESKKIKPKIGKDSSYMDKSFTDTQEASDMVIAMEQTGIQPPI
uniref:MIP05841p (inferred by orthology to a D. melanogaster protein) n=1 Tax=Strongyloides venezuelensis TaxID=75913 RepID=A0A0K0FBH7_STRVS